MKPPFFSIIIPTYNSATTVAVCLDSILNQSFQNYEVLIVDGNSNDSTISIIAHYASIYPNIRWISENDNGIYDAMNKGIKLAKGEWLYFLGSDDKLNNPQVLQQVFDINKKDYNVVYGNVKIVGDTAWAKDGDTYDRHFNLSKLLLKNICHQSIFYNKECFNDTVEVYNIGYKLCADWDLNFRLWGNKQFLFTNILIADFYGGGTTTKTNIDEAFSCDFNNNLKRYFPYKNLKKYLIVKQYFFGRIISSKMKSLNIIIKKL